MDNNGAAAGTDAGTTTNGAAAGADAAAAADTSAAAGQAPAAGSAGAAANPAPSANGQAPAARVETFDAAYVKSIREEAANNRVESVNQRKAAETEKDRADKAEATVRTMRVERAVEKLRGELNIDTTLTNRLLDQSALQFDDKGEPTNVKDVITKLGETFPAIYGQANTAGANPARGAKTAEEQLDAQWGARGTASAFRL